MEDILDIDRYLRGLLRRWWLIVALAILGVVVAVVITLLLPKTYQATTRILVTTPKLRAQFDSRLLSTTDLGLTRDLHRTFLALAKTRDLEEEVLAELGDRVPPSLRETGALSAQVEIQQLEGTSALYELTASASDPAFAQLLADVWAKHYVAQINELYSLSSESVADLANDLDQAAENLAEAETALRKFQGETGVGLVDNIQYPGTLSRKAGLTQRQNLFGLYERYGSQGTNLQAKSTTLGLYRAALDNIDLILQMAAENDAAGPASELPLELLADSSIFDGHVDFEQLSATTVGDVQAVLTRERARIQDVVDRLQRDLNELSTHLSQQSQELASLIREQALAEETYLILSLKQSENRTKESVSDSWMIVVEGPELPEAPASPSLLINVVSGAFLGGLLGLLGALLLTWWGR